MKLFSLHLNQQNRIMICKVFHWTYSEILTKLTRSIAVTVKKLNSVWLLILLNKNFTWPLKLYSWGNFICGGFIFVWELYLWGNYIRGEFHLWGKYFCGGIQNYFWGGITDLHLRGDYQKQSNSSTKSFLTLQQSIVFISLVINLFEDFLRLQLSEIVNWSDNNLVWRHSGTTNE